MKPGKHRFRPTGSWVLEPSLQALAGNSMPPYEGPPERVAFVVGSTDVNLFSEDCLLQRRIRHDAADVVCTSI
jgi:hypothetical protein